ncbi:hypothetical protein [Taibaiella chishuiensis]|uniref:Uncharacterized protein n=1 Tax=Taibaiella chishuiensis TaxID=1434707 RepID=A0A2P8D1D3_9BACT|nr:hypothetical protein [Taibaiella chishuiensis]PSK91040.1 hypothetical protein B0I18_10650 [Taibaiella chishuiensis]
MYAKIMDRYFNHAITADLFVACLFFLADYKFGVFSFAYLDKPSAMDFISNLIGTCISLAGFILAALTIIVSFKSNIKARRDYHNIESALELFLNTKNYERVVKFFKKAIVEFIIIVMLLYGIWLSSANLDSNIISMVLFSAVTMVVLTIWRSLDVLFKVMKTENLNRQ